MTEQSTGPDNDNNAGELRGQLAKRLAVAGVLVAMLLGVLAFFDYLASPPEDAEPVVFTRPVPVAPQKAVSQPVTPAENLPEPPAPEKTEAAAEPPPPTVEARPRPHPSRFRRVRPSHPLRCRARRHRWKSPQPSRLHASSSLGRVRPSCRQRYPGCFPASFCRPACFPVPSEPRNCTPS